MSGQKSQKKIATRVTQLGAVVEKRLLAYAAPASAIGMGILGFASPCQAEIVFTPTHVDIVQNGPTVPLDLDNDGIVDFQFDAFMRGHVNLGTSESGLLIEPSGETNSIWYIDSKGSTCAQAAPAGARIGALRPFVHGTLRMAYAFTTSSRGGAYCPWLRTNGAYLGLRFSTGGTIHYGWARVRVEGSRATLTGYAYETVPNKKIVAGKTSGPEDGADSAANDMPSNEPLTLGLLARGAARATAKPESGVPVSEPRHPQ